MGSFDERQIVPTAVNANASGNGRKGNYPLSTDFINEGGPVFSCRCPGAPCISRHSAYVQNTGRQQIRY